MDGILAATRLACLLTKANLFAFFDKLASVKTTKSRSGNIIIEITQNVTLISL